MQQKRSFEKVPVRRRRHRARLPVALAARSLGSLGLLPCAGKGAEDDLQLWTTAGIHGPLAGPVTGSLSVQPRLRDGIGELDRVVLSPTLAFPVTELVTAGLGYDAHWIDGPRDTVEHRVWEQMGLQTPIRTLALHHRVRLEQRFLEGVTGVAARLRYRLRASHPIADTGVDAVASNEVFFDLNTLKGGPDAGIGQNRTFAGLHAHLGERLAVEGGYQLQYVDRRPRDEANHVLMIGFSLAVP